MRDFDHWFADQGKEAEIEEDEEEFHLECRCGKDAWLTAAQIESGDYGWYVEWNGEEVAFSVCGGSQFCLT